MSGPPAYDAHHIPADAVAFDLGDGDDENIDLGIPPVSPTATVPVSSSTTSNAVHGHFGGKGVAPGYSPVSLSAHGSPMPGLANAPSAAAGVTGNIGHSTTGGTQPYPSIRVVGTDTLDESVATTILRDLKAIWYKLGHVLFPHGQNDILRDWDLWGPLVFCLSLAITLSVITNEDQSSLVFTGIFVIVWVGSAVVTVNTKLLGGKVSFFQSVCVLGYCIFPLMAAAFVSLFFRDWFLPRLICSLVGFAWATYASMGFLSNRHLDDRRTLAVYPIFLFYFVIGWIVLMV